MLRVLDTATTAPEPDANPLHGVDRIEVSDPDVAPSPFVFAVRYPDPETDEERTERLTFLREAADGGYECDVKTHNAEYGHSVTLEPYF